MMSDELPNSTNVDADTPLFDRREDLASWLSDDNNNGRVARTYLKASERVIARVTDGIYRQPASALRELISNAWDADANNVTIHTDAPRFARIYIRDDGAGMSYEVLSRMLHSIGGSAKRREEGQILGVTSASDPNRTDGGRLIIGKIGIGLFSVSQLSRQFKIITKEKDTNYRLIAQVNLRAYSEDGDGEPSRTDDDSFISGDVQITREHTDDIEGHGTQVILDDIKPRVRALLRSADRWQAIEEKEAYLANNNLPEPANLKIQTPRYHSGWMKKLPRGYDAPALLDIQPVVPWGVNDSAEDRMRLLIEAVENEFTRLDRPDIAHTLDAYLEMIWTLSLSVPVGYVYKHPFELTADDDVRLFWLSNDARGQAVELELPAGKTVREAVKDAGKPELEDGKLTKAGEFKVVIDGVELKRPIRFKFIQTERRGLDKAMLFVGTYTPNLSTVESAQRGGNLALEGYIYWNGRVIPKENNGLLIRIRGASGALFDPTFFKYQVSEQTRLRQITSELFIQQGLDAALNIDRESFNYSHPHVQLVTIWVHRAIRQLTNRHKDLSERARVQRRDQDATAAREAVIQYSESVWKARNRIDPPPEITLAKSWEGAHSARQEGSLAISREALQSLTIGGLSAAELHDREAKTQALIRVLAAYDILTDRLYEEQQQLVDAILKVFFGPYSE